jgi:uncharacterized membrane protein YfcA
VETDVDVGLALTLAAVIFVASVVNGVAGFGFALVAVAAFAVVLEPRPAVVLVSLITPLLQTFQLRYHWAYRSVAPRLVPMLIAAGIGTIVGANLLVVLPGYVLAIALGLFALWYVVSSLRTSPMLVTPETERRIAPIVGGVAGISNGALGASGPILGSYLLAIGLTGRWFVFAISITFAVMSAIRVGTLAVLGAYTPTVLVLGLGLAVPAWLGQRIGFWLQGRLSAQAFQRVILVALLIASANLLYRGVTQAIASLG